MMKGLICLLCVWSTLVWAQSDVTGNATIRLQAGAPDCNAQCHTVDVSVDVTGLSGSLHEAGLNAFVLAFDLSRGDVFASAVAGTNPELDWSFFYTARGTVDSGNRLVVVGSVAASNAPNQNYQVANLVFCGSAGDLTLTFVPEASSLGSRLVEGDGPGGIAMLTPAPLDTALPTSFSLTFFTGVSQWQTENIDYNLVAPTDEVVDIRDLVKLTNCGQP